MLAILSLLTPELRPAEPYAFVPLGVCAGADEDYAAWGMDGNPSAVLSKLFAEIRPKPSDTHNPFIKYFAAAPGNRVRYLVARPPSRSLALRTVQPADAEEMESTIGKDQVQIFRFESSHEAREIPFKVEYQVLGNPVVRLWLQKGEGSGGGMEFKIRKVASLTAPGQTFAHLALVENFATGLETIGGRVSKPTCAWTIALTQRRTGEGTLASAETGNLVFEPLDKSGRPIEYVNLQGRPLDTRATAAVDKERAGDPLGRKADSNIRLAFATFLLRFDPNATKPFQPLNPGNAYDIVTDVNPAGMSGLGVTTGVWRQQNLGPVPLEPTSTPPSPSGTSPAPPSSRVGSPS